MNISTLFEKDKEFDGVYFYKSSVKGEEEWSFTFLTLNEKRHKVFEQNDIGIKYQIILHENDKVEIFEAILGDPKMYLQNMINCDQEGMIIKKCKQSKKIISKILGKHKFKEFREIFEPV